MLATLTPPNIFQTLTSWARRKAEQIFNRLVMDGPEEWDMHPDVLAKLQHVRPASATPHFVYTVKCHQKMRRSAPRPCA